MFGEVKARVGGTAERFWWLAPTPVTGTPVFTIRASGGDVTPTLSVLRAPITITAVGNDRKTLTASTSISGVYQGAQGPQFGEAFLVAGADGTHSVMVREMTGTTVILADVLAAPISTSETITLNWALYGATLPTSLTASRQINIPWTVEYQQLWGLDISGYTKREEGLLHIVRQPFTTGLTSREISSAYPGLAQRMPRRQGDWTPQIEASEVELVVRLRMDLQQRGLTEDDVSGHRFRLAHAHLAAACIYDETTPDKAGAIRDRILGPFNAETGYRTGGMVSDILRSIWTDADRDGAIDTDEVDSIEGDRPADSKSFYTSSSYDSTTRKFTLGMKH